MKKTAFIVIAALPFLLWSRPESDFSLALTGESENESYQLRTLLACSLTGGSDMDRTLCFCWEAEPVSGDSHEETQRLCGKVDTPCFRAGLISLDGIYDIIETTAFPRPETPAEKGHISLAGEGDITVRAGAVIQRKDGSLMLHGLHREEYSQTGLLWQPDRGGNLTFATALIHTWDGEEPPGEDSWYGAPDGRVGTPLTHGLLRLQYFWRTSRADWETGGLGAGAFSPELIPGYGGILYLERASPAVSALVSLMANGGHWRSSRGKPAEWSRGIGSRVILFSGRPLELEGRTSLFLPGCFSVSPGTEPAEMGISRESSARLRGPFFTLFWEDVEPDDTDERRRKGGLELFGDMNHMRLEGQVQFCRGGSWNRKAKCGIGWKGTGLFLETRCDCTWTEEDGLPPSANIWKGRGEWKSFPPGTISLAVSSEGARFPFGGETFSVELVFSSGKM